MGYTFGVDYYPEHWPRERWQTDARMMREMGITIVRMAEFSWAKWEPREGEFHFEELDEVIALMANEGIDCILGTPSAAPPAWIIEETPEIQPTCKGIISAAVTTIVSPMRSTVRISAALSPPMPGTLLRTRMWWAGRWIMSWATAMRICAIARPAKPPSGNGCRKSTGALTA